MARKPQEEQQINEILKKVRKSTNGDIPVVFEDAELWYDIKESSYYMTLKIGMKKMTLIEEEE